MTQLQKRIGDDDEDDKRPKQSEIKDDLKAQEAVQKAKKLLDKIEQQKPKDGGHYAYCCGVKVRIPN